VLLLSFSPGNSFCTATRGKKGSDDFWFLGAESSRINLAFHQKPGREEIK
jgi:hypothetical protein